MVEKNNKPELLFVKMTYIVYFDFEHHVSQTCILGVGRSGLARDKTCPVAQSLGPLLLERQLVRQIGYMDARAQRGIIT